MDRNKAELALTLEVRLHGHRFYMKSADTSYGSLVRGNPSYTMPNRQGTEVLVGFNQPII